MISILIALAVCVSVVAGLFLLSKSEDPVEKKKNDDDREETSERIVYMSGYKPMWEKDIEL
jgi:hypothetical protein